MFEGIPWQIIGGLTPAGILLIGFLMMRGDLIPRIKTISIRTLVADRGAFRMEVNMP